MFKYRIGRIGGGYGNMVPLREVVTMIFKGWCNRL